MNSSRPYLLRALYEWIVENDMTPYLMVDASHEGVVVPGEFVENGKIILNLAPRAVEALKLDNDCVSFNARFSGNAMDVYLPIKAALAIYAKENGQGMVFSDEEDDPSGPGSPDKPGKPSLKLVK